MDVSIFGVIALLVILIILGFGVLYFLRISPFNGKAQRQLARDFNYETEITTLTKTHNFQNISKFLIIKSSYFSNPVFIKLKENKAYVWYAHLSINRFISSYFMRGSKVLNFSDAVFSGCYIEIPIAEYFSVPYIYSNTVWKTIFNDVCISFQNKKTSLEHNEILNELSNEFESGAVAQCLKELMKKDVSFEVLVYKHIMHVFLNGVIVQPYYFFGNYSKSDKEKFSYKMKLIENIVQKIKECL